MDRRIAVTVAAALLIPGLSGCGGSTSGVSGPGGTAATMAITLTPDASTTTPRTTDGATGEAIAQASSDCDDTKDDGRCTLQLRLGGADPYDYVVSKDNLPKPGKGVPVRATIRTKDAPVRVWWKDPTGKDIAVVVPAGVKKELRGLAVVEQEGDSGLFYVHFQLPGAGLTTIDATIHVG